jgi:hypothetical protein
MNQLFGQVDMIIVSFGCQELKQRNEVKGHRHRGSRHPARPRPVKGHGLLGLEQDIDVLWHKHRDNNRDIAWSSMMIVWLVGIDSVGVNVVFSGS